MLRPDFTPIERDATVAACDRLDRHHKRGASDDLARVQHAIDAVDAALADEQHGLMGSYRRVFDLRALFAVTRSPGKKYLCWPFLVPAQSPACGSACDTDLARF
jgi:hypothetical protein